MLPLIMTQTEQPMVGETRKGELRHVDFGGKMAARGIELTTRETAQERRKEKVFGPK